jgi:hypothetical protein
MCGRRTDRPALADNMEALKHNFLLRGFFNRRGYYNLDEISPADYRSGVLENGKRKAMRIWLRSSLLFAPGPDGTEVLSGEGRARIGSAMSTYLNYLPSNPLAVERDQAPDSPTKDRWDGVSLMLFPNLGELQLANGGTR